MGGDDGRGVAYKMGMEYLKLAFKKDNTSSAAAGALATHFLAQPNFEAVRCPAESRLASRGADPFPHRPSSSASARSSTPTPVHSKPRASSTSPAFFTHKATTRR